MNYDLDAMWDFRAQYISITKKASKDLLFYTIQNFDGIRQQPDTQLNSESSYTITIS